MAPRHRRREPSADRRRKRRRQPLRFPIAHWPATKKWQEEVLSSRLGATTTLAGAIARSPEPAALLSASGMSAYGADRGDEILTETSSLGTGFLSEVVHAWEAATEAAVDAGSRVCLLRTCSGRAVQPLRDDARRRRLADAAGPVSTKAWAIRLASKALRRVRTIASCPIRSEKVAGR